jgi:uncharacterized protein
MTAIAPRITPLLNDLNRPFWTGGGEGVLQITRCRSCRRWVFLLSATCDECGGSTAYEATSGKGTVFTHTTNEHPYHPAVPVPVPYNISIVELADKEGLRFTTKVVGCPPGEVHIGMRVRVQFASSTARSSSRSSSPMPLEETESVRHPS